MLKVTEQLHHGGAGKIASSLGIFSGAADSRRYRPTLLPVFKIQASLKFFP